MKNDYEAIKKEYGERVARFCREIVPELFEYPGLLPQILEKSFAPHSALYDDLKILGKFNVRNYLYSRINIDEPKFTTNKSVRQLLREAGYSLYECETVNDVLEFKKFYAPGEVLCTFHNDIEERFRDSAYFFLVTDNAFSLNRNNYKNPSRDDEYGRSIVCLQIDRDYHFIKMTTRYNHAVDLADSMFSNNLDNIIPGLTDAFEREYGYKINQTDNISSGDLSVLSYIETDEQILYKYNSLTNNKYYCPNNIVIDDGRVVQLDKGSKVLLDYFVVDFHDKSISAYDSEINDYFKNKKYKKISVDRYENHLLYSFIFEDDMGMTIESDLNNKIVGVRDSDSVEIGDSYLEYCWNIEKVDFPNVVKVGNNFLSMCYCLQEINMPRVKNIGDNFLSANKFVRYIAFNDLRMVGNNFMCENENITELHMDSLVAAGNYFLNRNLFLTNLNLPNVMLLGSNSLASNDRIKHAYLPMLRDAGQCSFDANYDLYNYAESVMMQNSMRGDYDVDVEEVSSKKSR